jgi:DNA-binding PadR family transcriptional regulator
MKRERVHVQLVALNLTDVMKEVAEHPPDIPGFKISRLEYLISLILTHKQDKHAGAYSVLNMKYMSNIVPGAGQYLKFLAERGIVEWKNYSAGRNSRLYRLTEEGPTAFRPITDKTLIRRIEQTGHKSGLQNSKKYPALHKWVNQVELDREGALQTIREEYERRFLYDPSTAEARRTYSLGAIARISEGNLYFKVSPTNNRLDTNFTALPRELVKHITIKSQKPYEMDISNSQPFFLSTLFEMTPAIEKVCTQYLGHDYTMIIKSLHVAGSKDGRLYSLLVSEGRFYNYMRCVFDREGIPYADRDDLKEQLFIVFFGDLRAKRYSTAARVFEREFPSVQQMIDKIKREDHRRLAVLLQRIESDVMLNRVAREIGRQLPNMPMLTKHDSILPFKLVVYGHGEIDQARQIMVEIITEVTGCRPQGRMKRYV